MALSWMTRLSPAVTYHDPRKEPSPSPSPSLAGSDPELILLLSWMGAREVHIAKYVAQHRRIYPSSRILVAQCPLTHVVFPWRTRRDLAPALPHLRDVSELQAEAGDDTPRMLMHIFSNGGVHTASHLLSMLRGRGGQPRDTTTPTSLPRHVVVFDSCPGYFRWMSSYNALMQMLPWWTGPVVHSVIAMVCFYHFLRRMPAVQDRNARALRSPGLLATEARRTYLYGTKDDLVLWQDVEDNARRAGEAGFNVRLEKFVGAKHVDIMRADQERYWKAVRTSWVQDSAIGSRRAETVVSSFRVHESAANPPTSA